VIELAALSGAGAALCVPVALLMRRDLKLAGVADTGRAAPSHWVARLGAAVLAAVLVVDPRLRERFDRRIWLAGWRVSADRVVGASAATAAVAFVATVLAGPVGMLMFAVAGFPVLQLRRAAARTMRDISREVPGMLDTLAAATKGGTPLSLAFDRAADGVDGRLGDELRAVVNRVALGRRWEEELGVLARRCGSTELLRAVTLLTRARRLGTPVSVTLSDLAADVRRARRAGTAQRARTAPVKMLLPLVFLILPAFLLLTVVPVFVSTVEAIR
jgi:tight adherence protein C